MNWTSSTKPQEPRFTAEEICKILKECRGLAEIIIKCDNLEINYRPQGPGDALYQSQVEGVTQNTESSLPKDWNEQASLMDGETSQDSYEAQSILENPFDYEQAQIDFHLGKDKGLALDGPN